MAINKITAPLATGPSYFADPVINQLATLLTDCNHGLKVNNGVVKAGAVFNIGGSTFMADSDTTISGTQSGNYVIVQFTVSGDTATVAYASSFSGLTWNGVYQGYYDTSGNYYYTDGLVKQMMTCDRTAATIYGSQIPAYMVAMYDGTFTLVSGASVSDSNYAGTSQIYINGSAYGTAHSISSTSIQEVSDEITVNKGDVISLHLSTSTAGSVVGSYIKLQLVT